MTRKPLIKSNRVVCVGSSIFEGHFNTATTVVGQMFVVWLGEAKIFIFV